MKIDLANRLECLGLAVELAKPGATVADSLIGADIVALAEQFVAFLEGNTARDDTIGPM